MRRGTVIDWLLCVMLRYHHWTTTTARSICIHVSTKKVNQMLFIITLTFYYNFHPVVEGPPLAASPAAHTLQNGDAGAQVPK